MNILLKAINSGIESFINDIIQTYSLPPSEKKKCYQYGIRVEKSDGK